MMDEINRLTKINVDLLAALEAYYEDCPCALHACRQCSQARAAIAKTKGENNG